MEEDDFEMQNALATSENTPEPFKERLMSEIEESWIWVFQGDGARLPIAVFDDRRLAEEWIARDRVSGLLTAYPVNQSAYDWAVGRGYFEPRTEAKKTATFKQRFTSASLPHHHYVDGAMVG